MKDYGVIFADNGGHGMITGTNDPRWSHYESPIRVEFASAFSQVSLSDFEVIQLGWRPAKYGCAPTHPSSGAILGQPTRPPTEFTMRRAAAILVPLVLLSPRSPPAATGNRRPARRAAQDYVRSLPS